MNSKRAILLIEDTRELREIFTEYFQRKGFRVFIAVDGEDGLLKLKSLIPDIIVLDIIMPKLDGFEVCKEIKKNQKLKNVPIILYTAKSNPINKIKGASLGVDAYITKPCTMSDIYKQVMAVLNK